MKRIVLLIVLFVLVAGGFAMDFGAGVVMNTKAGTAYTRYSDVRYAEGEGRQLLDLYLPTKTEQKMRPAVVVIHGGGWAKGDKTGARERQFAEFMVDQGYVAVSINYTLTTYEGEVRKSKRLEGGWPKNIRDCKNALAWIVEHANELGVDTNRLAVMGGSAGGHLALLTGLSNGNTEFGDGCFGGGTVRCIVNFYGIPDIRRWGGLAFIDEPEAEHPEIWAKASPVEYLTNDSPPILIVHGTEDPTVPIALSDKFAEILEDKGVPFEYIKVEGAKHSFALQTGGMDLRPVVREFLKRNVCQENP